MSFPVCQVCNDFLSAVERKFNRTQCYSCRDLANWTPPDIYDAGDVDCSSESHIPKFRTTKADERAILRAIYDLGLIKDGDVL
jgi:hypothetical protein